MKFFFFFFLKSLLLDLLYNTIKGQAHNGRRIISWSHLGSFPIVKTEQCVIYSVCPASAYHGLEFITKITKPPGVTKTQAGEQKGGRGENLREMENKPVCLSAANSGCPASCESPVCCWPWKTDICRRVLNFRLAVDDLTWTSSQFICPSRFTWCEPRSRRVTIATLNDRKVEDGWKGTGTNTHTHKHTRLSLGQLVSGRQNRTQLNDNVICFLPPLPRHLIKTGTSSFTFHPPSERKEPRWRFLHLLLAAVLSPPRFRCSAAPLQAFHTTRYRTVSKSIILPLGRRSWLTEHLWLTRHSELTVHRVRSIGRKKWKKKMLCMDFVFVTPFSNGGTLRKSKLGQIRKRGCSDTLAKWAKILNPRWNLS